MTNVIVLNLASVYPSQSMLLSLLEFVIAISQLHTFEQAGTICP